MRLPWSGVTEELHTDAECESAQHVDPAIVADIASWLSAQHG